ncbi:MAG TPA: hypothetical protein VGY91_05185 [Chthoniobacterales bacterium]|nr:hypothetical protein [Chthoniobacterales bacterium]
MERDVTNEQRRRRTLFKPTLWAVVSWLIFCVALSLRPAPFLFRLREPPRSAGEQKWGGMLVVRALKISQLTEGGMPPTYDSMH